MAFFAKSTASGHSVPQDIQKFPGVSGEGAGFSALPDPER